MNRVLPYRCATCQRPSTRMFGVIAAVKLPDGATSPRARVLAYCAAHKDHVVPTFLTELEKEGDEVVLVSDPPAELRPPDAKVFLAWADQELSQAVQQQTGSSTFDLVDPDSPPQECPHCGSHLSWDSGPHTADARARGARAWECRQCGAAGMLTRLPNT